MATDLSAPPQSKHRSPFWTFRKLFWGTVIVILGIPFLLMFTAPYWMTGGCYKGSPDGNYLLEVDSRLAAGPGDAYTATLWRVLQDPKPNQKKPPASHVDNQPSELKQFYKPREKIHTLIFYPKTMAVGGAREGITIRWSPQNEFADVLQHEIPLFRIYVPREQPKQP